MKSFSCPRLTFSGSYLWLTAIVAAALFFTRHEMNSEHSRRSYEEFLLSEARVGMPAAKKHTPGADSPEMASLQEYFMTLDPAEKRVPSERLAAAYNVLLSEKYSHSKNTAAALRWTGTDTEMGGRTRAIMWDPLVKGKVWAGGVTGGLWYNNNIYSADSAWHPVNDMWDNLSISSITCDPANPKVMYAGTGEAPTALITYRESSGRGVGIWKSTDGGGSWLLLPSTAGFAFVTDIAIHTEENKSVVYAGTVSGYYHGIHLNSPSDGLFRSADGGLTWQQVLPAIAGSSVPYGVSCIELGADDRMYVGTMQNADGKGGGVILMSDDGRPGTWTVFDKAAAAIAASSTFPLPGRVVLAAAPSEAGTVYAAFATGIKEAGAQPVYRGGYLYKTTDGGLTWNEVNLPGGSNEWATLAWHALALGVDQRNPQMLYAGGLDLWKSADGGNSWTHRTDWAKMYSGGGDDYVHADQHAIVYKPGSSTDILFGSDGGVFMTQTGKDETPVFVQKNKGFNTLQFYTCAIHPSAGVNEFIGGLQDNGTLYYPGSPLTINDMISGGDGAACFWDEDEPEQLITSVYYNRYYLFSQGSYSGYIDQYSGVFINPADYSSLNNTLYANAADFWGGNSGKILRVASIPQSNTATYVPLGIDPGAYFSHVKVSPYSTKSSTTLFLGTVSGRLFKVKNAQGQPVVTEIGSSAFPEGNISCVAVGGSEDTLLVAFSNYGVSSLWQTCNGGKSWSEKEGNLPDMPVRWALYQPQNSRQAMIATELGVWVTGSLDSDEVKWVPQNDGMANVRVDMLTLRKADNTVLAATHGRGLFSCEFQKDIYTGRPNSADAGEALTAISQDHNLLIYSKLNLPVTYTVYDINGRQVMNGSTGAFAGRHTLQAAGLKSGIYIISLRSGAATRLCKVVL